MDWLAKLLGREKRRSKRHVDPPLIAFYWDGEVATPHPIPDISNAGLFVRTVDRWSPRTLLRVTLQRSSGESEKAEESVNVLCRVVRTGDDGVGMAIMFAEKDQSGSATPSGSVATRKQLKKFLEHLVEDTTETPAAKGTDLPFSKLGLTMELSSPEDRSTGQESIRQDDAERSEPDSPGPASG